MPSRIDPATPLCYNGGMPRADYHSHTPLCLHAEGEPEAFVEQALALGMHAYGIADHAPMPREREPFDNWRMRCDQLPGYLSWIERAREAAHGTGLHILAGLECDWLPGIEPWVERLRGEYDWDYFIGSVHYLGSGESVDDAVFANRCITGSAEGDWYAYWQSLREMVRSGLFDIVGHMDLVKIWNRRPAGPLMPFYEPALAAIEGSGMVVELNAAGWHKPCAEQYPSEELLGALMERRIPIVLDSDAHRPADLSRDWERARGLLASLCPRGLREFTHPAKHSKTLLHVYGPL